MTDRLVIENQSLLEADLSSRKVKAFCAIASTFDRCDFRGVRWRDGGMGAGMTPSVYRDCVFDGARIQANPPGRARFERCSFRDVVLKDWYCFNIEMIDCVFTGRIEHSYFNGRARQPDETFGTNEFHGNDFSGAKLVDVGFRTGIDLRLQRLPEDEDLLYVWDGPEAVARAEGAVNTWSDLESRRRAQGLLEHLRRELDGQQRQLIIEVGDTRKVFGDAVVDRVFPALINETN
ncbi:MAG: hypothetical protein ABR549_06560 [Mycobacteriales bacterium]